MKLSTAAYEALTPPQRVQATIAALARGDEAEAGRLKRTCPMKTYRQRDADYADAIERAFLFGAAVEHDLLSLALTITAGLMAGDIEGEHLQPLAAVEVAARRLVTERGVKPEHLQAIVPPRHPTVAALLKLAPEPDEEAIERTLVRIREAWPA